MNCRRIEEGDNELNQKPVLKDYDFGDDLRFMITADDDRTAAERWHRSAFSAVGYHNVGFEIIGGCDCKTADYGRTKRDGGKSDELCVAFYKIVQNYPSGKP